MSIIDEIFELLEDSANNIDDKRLKKKINNLFKGEKLHRNIEDIKQYRKTEKQKIKKEKHIKLQQFYLILEYWIEIRDFIGAKWDSTKDKDNTQYKINTTMRLMNKSIQICFDMISLFESGGLVSAYILWRSLYENYVIIKYLIVSDDIISKRFNEQAQLEMKKIKDNFDTLTKNKIKNETNDIKKYKQYEWANINNEPIINSLADIIKKIEENVYYPWYKYISQITHASAFSVNKSIIREKEYGNIDMIGVFKENLNEPYILTISIMEDTVKVILNYFLEDQEKEIMKQINIIVHEQIKND